MENPFAIKHSTDYPTKDCIFVGAFIPQHLSDFLNLYAVVRGVPKSHLLRDRLQKWYEGVTANEYTEEHCISILVDRALTQWYQKVEVNKERNGWLTKKEKNERFERYLELLRAALMTRGVPIQYVRETISKIARGLREENQGATNKEGTETK